jgi:methionyl-tRNA synthetase
VIGKDITRFHCVIWPAMLQAAGLPLPERVWAHGWVLYSGERFSKSAGVRIDLDEAIGRHGADALRYFLLREVPFDADGNFSYERFDERYNADLANALGNLASRTVAMVERYFDGVVPDRRDAAVDDHDDAHLARADAAMTGADGYLLHEALRSVWLTVQQGNEYVDRRAPWKQAKDPAQRGDLEVTLAALVRKLARQAVVLSPFMPEKMGALWRQLGGPGEVGDQRIDRLAALSVGGWRVTRGDPLFPKIAAPAAG